MSVNVNAYNAASSINTAQSSKSTAQNAASSLGMTDFLNLLTTQLANQDILEPTDNTDFIAQMAQFTSLEAMNTLTELTYAQYGASMIGKTVLVGSYSESGSYIEDQGVVSAVNFANGECTIVVNDYTYSLDSVLSVYTPGASEDGDSADSAQSGTET